MEGGEGKEKKREREGGRGEGEYEVIEGVGERRKRGCELMKE